MTLFEALESGRKFRRSSWVTGRTSVGNELFSKEDVLATDFEFVVEDITISIEELTDTIRTVVARIPRQPNREALRQRVTSELINELFETVA